MSAIPRPPDDGAARRRILASARLCFTHHGYGQVELREVAWGASVPVEAVLDQFASKQGLFAAVLDDCLNAALGPWAEPAAIGVLLRALADPAGAAIAAGRLRAAGLGSLGTHRLLAAARVLGDAAVVTSKQGPPFP